MSKAPNPAPPGDKPAKAAPSRWPAWVNWLWLAALAAVVVMYVFLPGINVSTPVSLSYSQFITDVSAHKIKTVNFGNGSSGSNTVATGDRASGKAYTTVIPGQPSAALSSQLTAGGVKSYSRPALSGPGAGVRPQAARLRERRRASAASTSALSVRSQENSGSLRPKWP